MSGDEFGVFDARDDLPILVPVEVVGDHDITLPAKGLLAVLRWLREPATIPELRRVTGAPVSMLRAALLELLDLELAIRTAGEGGAAKYESAL